MAEKLINISADSVDDFMEKVSKAVGEGDGVMGATKYHISTKFSMDGDKIKKVTFQLEVDIKRAHWSGGNADANNKKAIQAAESLNDKHEHKHEKLAEDICKREFAKAQKDLVGKTQDEAGDAVKEIEEKIDKAYEDLDNKEGMTEVTPNADGTFSVKQVGA